jgi:hypothetical protein
MSYEIIYNKQFVKVSETEFIPIILVGSNNCTEMSYNGRERRERSWWTFKYVLDGKCIGTLEEMLKSCEDNRIEYIKSNDDYNDKNYGYFSSLAIGGASTRNTTFGMYKGLFTTGCKKALTVEELHSWGLHVEVRHGYVNSEELEKTGLERKSYCPKSTSELVERVKELEEYYKGTNIGVYVMFIDSGERVKDKQKLINRINYSQVKKVKIQKEVTEYFTFKNEKGYFVKNLKWGYRYVWHHSYSEKRIYNEKQAIKFCEKLNIRHENKFSIEKVVLKKPELITI